ncbi:SDR family NAD(P)-dependent oxidoreductase [Mycolicibacterium sp. CBMA 226]|uniref:SDR family NAD(P)-dependent oxidoreductase n=1 Tax=Mycolicibacterium sp. CBMA 226 TaxID=2606611 RepID=UPI0013195F17|nr:SDR family NAD(P)-dependent oxidoreductase [Mycolicibacterium sp. CBMA 226]QGW61301.1 putative NAD-dependent oxidoreductase [Mycolicibacterium sp.]
MTRYDLAGRTVAITGSTGGLGTALAAAVRSRGANLALLDLDGDLTRAAEHFGHLDVAVADAEIDTIAPTATLDPAAFERVIDINLTGVWRAFRAALPHLLAHRGYLLAISSMAAFAHSPLQSPYAASKAGVWAMCDSIRLKVRHLGIGVGSAHPPSSAPR